MKQVPMSIKMLFTIQAIQQTKNVAVSESCIGINNNWLSSVRKYFFSLPDEIISELGLVKNEFCLRAILDFKQTDEMSSLDDSELAKLNFCY